MDSFTKMTPLDRASNLAQAELLVALDSNLNWTAALKDKFFADFQKVIKDYVNGEISNVTAAFELGFKHLRGASADKSGRYTGRNLFKVLNHLEPVNLDTRNSQIVPLNKACWLQDLNGRRSELLGRMFSLHKTDNCVYMKVHADEKQLQLKRKNESPFIWPSHVRWLSQKQDDGVDAENDELKTDVSTSTFSSSDESSPGWATPPPTFPFKPARIKDTVDEEANETVLIEDNHELLSERNSAPRCFLTFVTKEEQTVNKYVSPYSSRTESAILDDHRLATVHAEECNCLIRDMPNLPDKQKFISIRVMNTVRNIYAQMAQDFAPKRGFSNAGFLARREREISTLVTCGEIASAFYYDAIRGNRVCKREEYKDRNMSHLAIAAVTVFESQININKTDKELISAVKERNHVRVLDAVDRHWPGLKTFEGLIHESTPLGMAKEWAQARGLTSSRATGLLDLIITPTGCYLPRWMSREFNDQMALLQYELAVCFDVDMLRLQLCRATSGIKVLPIPPHVRNVVWGDI